MTSLSVPTASPVLAAFDFDLNTPPRSPQPHRRRPSRNPNVTVLPTFNFNQAQDEAVAKPDGEEQGSPTVKSVVHEGQRRSPRPMLPEFKFNPGADLPPERPSSPTHPVLQEMALNQQRAIRSARPAPLPAFTFAPHTPSTHGSPSPTKPDFESQSSLRVGHRRGVSEFVGGGGTDGPKMVSTSPEKPEYRPPPRMHAHRRSQAVSVSDIDTSELIKANALAKARAGSTPTTPADAQTFSFARASPQMRQSMSSVVRTPPSSPRRRDSAPGIRPRVGFSEHVDVIPRPLSMISSETEGSNSTIRGCHSLTGSINSIASPTPRPTLVISSSSESCNTSPERPQTADAQSTLSAGMASNDNVVSLISLPKRPLSASGSPGTLNTGSPPNKKKHFWFNHPNNMSPLSTPRADKSDAVDIFVTSPAKPKRLEVFGDQARPKTSSGEGTTSRKRKYHTWTAGIFSRKSEKRPSKMKQPPMPNPPVLIRRPSDRLNEIFDADDTIILREPSPATTRVRSRTQPIPPIQTPSTCVPQEQIMSPVLDLDAALGPFGSEEKLCQDNNNNNNRQVPASRMAKLHSSERRGTLDAFGTVHRRAESAPIMPAINRATFGVHRMGSNPSLSEDVFDEEEEDKLLAEEFANANPSSKLERIQSRTRRSATTSNEPDSATPTGKTSGGLGLSIEDVPRDGVIIVDAEEDIARADARSSDSTIEAPSFPEYVAQKRPMSSPMTFAYPAPRSLYASSTEGRTTSASMISSPDADHVSFETLSRPPRSQGEPSPDFILRASNDDLPSLTDSLSSGAFPRFSSSAGTRSSGEQRSASMIVPSTSRSNNSQAWKRASLASLNRLIPGSANGSKLKFETVPDSSVMEEKNKRRSNRISKLLFWRSKEKDEK